MPLVGRLVLTVFWLPSQGAVVLFVIAFCTNAVDATVVVASKLLLTVGVVGVPINEGLEFNTKLPNPVTPPVVVP